MMRLKRQDGMRMRPGRVCEIRRILARDGNVCTQGQPSARGTKVLATQW